MKRSVLLSLLMAVPIVSPAFGAGRMVHAARPVRGEYVVLFKDPGLPTAARRTVVATVGASVRTDFRIIPAAAINATEAQAIALSKREDVAIVQENNEMSIATNPPCGSWNTQCNCGVPPDRNSPASRWGLDRVDQTAPTNERVDGQYTWCATGYGVRAYIIDTGILPQHQEFTGRVDPAPGLQTYLASVGQSLSQPSCWLQVGTSDQWSVRSGHGSAVAGIVGGSRYGIARGVTLVDARGAQCDGKGITTARLLAVLDWIDLYDTARAGHSSVINMSFSGLYTSPGIDQTVEGYAIAQTVDTYNIPVVVAAGNDGENAFWYVPANANRAITVGGLNKDSDSRWPYSNYGYTVAFYAPAQYVQSVSTRVPEAPNGWDREYLRSEIDPGYPGGCNIDGFGYPIPDTCVSGTSFAAPHVTGIIARYLERHPGATRNSIVTALQNTSATYSGAQIVEPGGRSVPIIVFNECP